MTDPTMDTRRSPAHEKAPAAPALNDSTRTAAPANERLVASLERSARTPGAKAAVHELIESDAFKSLDKDTQAQLINGIKKAPGQVEEVCKGCKTILEAAPQSERANLAQGMVKDTTGMKLDVPAAAKILNSPEFRSLSPDEQKKMTAVLVGTFEHQTMTINSLGVLQGNELKSAMKMLLNMAPDAATNPEKAEYAANIASRRPDGFSKLSADQKQQWYQAAKESVDMAMKLPKDARNDLADVMNRTVLSNGKQIPAIITLDQEGNSLMSSLKTIVSTERHESLKGREQELTVALLRHLADPQSICQAGYNTCGPTSVEYMLAKFRPAEYARFVEQLTGSEGTFRTQRGYHIGLNTEAASNLEVDGRKRDILTAATSESLLHFGRTLTNSHIIFGAIGASESYDEARTRLAPSLRAEDRINNDPNSRNGYLAPSEIKTIIENVIPNGQAEIIKRQEPMGTGPAIRFNYDPSGPTPGEPTTLFTQQASSQDVASLIAAAKGGKTMLLLQWSTIKDSDLPANGVPTSDQLLKHRGGHFVAALGVEERTVEVGGAQKRETFIKIYNPAFGEQYGTISAGEKVDSQYSNRAIYGGNGILLIPAEDLARFTQQQIKMSTTSK